ncbi:hypothetical protein QO002_005882 [Pararhizobium capsulatum DSM 1112]|uniref:Entry exclusion lipoprotein TrbK n=1 Tax=Pararhizobium capsulatum DSM 1112 TaxID=1121113 RepID=A0ABU0C1Z1_9HYPH|nr:hypothetical protein [Pararhizobium capsulatum]MDQ0323675.1 hypothetical protein [Pararhizobium capsulatum DSM 1112]
MFGWLKAVILTATCAVGIACGAYLAWKENGAANAEAKLYEQTAMRSVCGMAKTDPTLLAMKQHCIEDGYITED